MKFTTKNFFASLTLIVLSFGCGSNSSTGTCSAVSYPDPGQAYITPSGNNVVPITVDGSLCQASSQYSNEPCVSVTICTPGTGTCQTISNILVDTGSYGLRIFNQVITVPLNPSAAGTIGNCAKFGTGSTWGPVKLADLKLGGEPTILSLPIQVIDSTFATVPTSCGTVDTTPQKAGYNGILGIGLLRQDCGNDCVGGLVPETYYSCTVSKMGPTCTVSKMPLANQVQNPIPLLTLNGTGIDNNGVILTFPSVPANGLPSLNGSMILGIDTQSNNISSGVSIYKTDAFANFQTQLNGKNYPGFIDSGSNGLYFPKVFSSLPSCGGSSSSFYCPACSTNISATNTGVSNSSSGSVTFQVANLNSLPGTNLVFSNTAGVLSDFVDYGLPFFYGRSVFFGIEDKPAPLNSLSLSPLGNGPYYAY